MLESIMQEWSSVLVITSAFRYPQPDECQVYLGPANRKSKQYRASRQRATDVIFHSALNIGCEGGIMTTVIVHNWTFKLSTIIQSLVIETASLLKDNMSLLTSLNMLRVSSYQIPAYKGIPNTSVQGKPLLIYHSAFKNTSVSSIETHLASVGEVVPAWRYTMYSDTHFHSTTHEVLCIASGSAKCCFGGEENPGRVEPSLSTGDVVIVPAGAGHKLLEDYGGFLMIGSYPTGKSWDMCYGRVGEEDKVQGISELDWFRSDPIYGSAGPVHDV